MNNIKLFIVIILIAGSCQPHSSDSGKPEIFARGIVSTKTTNESLNYLTQDGLTIFFTRATRDYSTSIIMTSKYSGNQWQEPEVLPFSGNFYDAGFAFSPDLNTAYFTSKRPTGNDSIKNGWNIWMVNRTSEQWSEPIMLPYPVNSSASECCMVINQRGDVYFSSDRNGSWDIWSAQLDDYGWNSLEKLEINTEWGEWPGYIDESSKLLIFSSIRKTGIGGDDIYYTRKENGRWKTAELMDSTINSEAYEDTPLIFGDRLFFSSNKKTDFSDGTSNIFSIELSTLGLKNE